MNKYYRDLILQILLIVGLIASLFLFITDLQPLIPTLALLFGLGNVYYTTKRSVKFIYFDMLWILFSLISLFITDNLTDMVLYIFYIFVGFYQYFNWKRNLQDGEAELIKPCKNDMNYVLLGLAITIVIMLAFPNSNNLLLGSLISGLGISASISLAKRHYFSEIMFTFVNLMQIYLFYVSGLYALAVIPVLFLCNSVVFVIFNRK